MAEWLMRDLAIEEDVQMEMKYTIAHNKKTYVKHCALTYEETNKNRVKLNLTHDMGWQKSLFS